MKQTATKTKLTGPIVVHLLAALLFALALFQWYELLVVRHGGHSICSVNATVNCEAVWNSAFASRIHNLLGVPVAALGAIWGLAAMAVTLIGVARARKGQPTRTTTVATRVLGVIGVLACLTFGVASFRAHALCLLCLTTYVLAIAFAICAYALLEGPAALEQGELARGGGVVFAALLASYLLALYPGLHTPHAGSMETAFVKAAAAASTQGLSVEAQGANKMLAQFFSELPEDQKEAVSASLAMWKASQPMAQSFPVRELVGSPSAPVKVVDFTDIKCPHCLHLVEAMKDLRRAVPGSAMSVESRYFPLDSECNPAIPSQYSDHTGVRCLGAKAEICLEGAPDFLQLRDKLFENQNSLTKDSILEIASSGSVSRQQLLACIQSPDTNAKLQQDIRYAMLYHADGTPLVLVNGRQTLPVPAFLWAMAVSQGNPDLPAFASLPAPPPPESP